MECDADLQAELAELEGSFRYDSKVVGPPKVVDVPWLEKYRPIDLGSLVHQTEVVHMLRQTLLGASFPHLLFHGPPGTGKTSAILAATRQLYAGDHRQNVLELNASTERGIDVIREKVKLFARFKPAKGKAFKVVILDEADSMTKEAQGALRRLMETQIKTTRFCILCNYVTKIIDPIISRTVHFRFEPLPPSSIISVLQHIATKEHISIASNALQTIATNANGDMRRAIHTLHSASLSKCHTPQKTMDDNANSISTDTKTVATDLTKCNESLVTDEDVLFAANLIPSGEVERIINILMDKRSKLIDVRLAAKHVVWSAYPILQLLRLLMEQVATIESPKFDDHKRSKIALQLTNTEERLLLGGDDLLQLTALFVSITSILTL